MGPTRPARYPRQEPRKNEVQQIVDTFRERYPDRARVSVITINATAAAWAAFFRAASLRLGGVALVALLLAVSEVATLVRFILDQRTYELAVRRATGASPRSVVWIALCEAAGSVLPGTAVGVGAAALLTPAVYRWFLLQGPRLGLVAIAGAVAAGAAMLAIGTTPVRSIVRTPPAGLFERSRE